MNDRNEVKNQGRKIKADIENTAGLTKNGGKGNAEKIFNRFTYLMSGS